MRDQCKANAIVRIAIVSVLFVGMVLILIPGMSQARDVETVQHSNPTSFQSTSLKTIIAGDYYPYTFVNDKGIPNGFSVDIAKAVACVMDLKLIISVDIWDNMIKALGAALLERPTSYAICRTYAILWFKRMWLAGDLWPSRSHKWPSCIVQAYTTRFLYD
jgi:hypothetical protein